MDIERIADSVSQRFRTARMQWFYSVIQDEIVVVAQNAVLLKNLTLDEFQDEYDDMLSERKEIEEFLEGIMGEITERYDLEPVEPSLSLVDEPMFVTSVKVTGDYLPDDVAEMLKDEGVKPYK